MSMSYNEKMEEYYDHKCSFNGQFCHFVSFDCGQEFCAKSKMATTKTTKFNSIYPVINKCPGHKQFKWEDIC